MSAVDFTLLTPEELDAVLEMPAMPPPDGEVSNFVNPPNQNGMAIAIMTICLVSVVLCLSIRAYARVILLKRVQAQEYMIFTAFVSGAVRYLPQHRRHLLTVAVTRDVLSVGFIVLWVWSKPRDTMFTHGMFRFDKR